jgi:hypothetical protein
VPPTCAIADAAPISAAKKKYFNLIAILPKLTLLLTIAEPTTNLIFGTKEIGLPVWVLGFKTQNAPSWLLVF